MDIISIVFILTQLLAPGICTPHCGNVCFYDSQYRIADCSEVELDRIPSHRGCSGASFLDLSLNAITSLQSNSLQRYSQLENLDISSNAISEVHPLAFVGLHAVTNIDLSQNHIAMLPASVFYYVKDTIVQINLEGDEIVELAEGTFANLTKLTALFLGHNQLTTLSPNLFRDLSALLRLHVNSNRLTHISDGLLEPLHHLKILDLSSNLIMEVPSTLFELLPSCIETITLANNRLTYIPKPHFREPSMSPQTLDIRNNNITDATNITYFFGETEKLLLEGNPFRCDCSFDAVREWIQRDELSRRACTWTCVHPVTMEAVLARDLVATDTRCPETTTVNTVARSVPPDDVIIPVNSKDDQEEDHLYPIVIDSKVLVSPMPVDNNITHHSFISILNDWSVPLPIIVIVLVVLLLLVILVFSTVIIGFAICLCQTNKRIKNMTDAIVKSQKIPKAISNIVNKLKLVSTPKSKQNENIKPIAKEDEGMVKLNLLNEFNAAEVNQPETKCQVHADENVKINITENHLHDKETTLDQSFGTKSPLPGEKDGLHKRTPSKDDGGETPDKSKPKTEVTDFITSPNKLKDIPENGEAGNVIDHGEKENSAKMDVRRSTQPGEKGGAVGKRTPQDQKRNQNEGNRVQNTKKGVRKLKYPVTEQSPLISNDSELMKKGGLPDTAQEENKPKSFPKSANKCTGNKSENRLTDITNQDKVCLKGKGPFELRNGPCQTSSNC